MRLFKQFLVIIILAGVAAAVWQFYLFEKTATETARDLPVIVVDQMDATRSSLLAEADKQATGIRQDLTGQIEGARKELLARADSQLTATRKDAIGVVEDAVHAADKRVGDSLVRVDSALAEIHGLHEDVKPIIDNTVAVTANTAVLAANGAKVAADVHQYIDENYYDLYALPDTANVMLRAVAETSMQVGRAAPAVADAVIKESNSITKPKHWYEKFFTPALDVLRVMAALL
jgi:ElaB/YqjD/DUF883 family membrane-anchored ribosome-binding protein